MTVENSNITVGILTLSVAIPDIQVFPVFGGHIAISGFRSLTQSLGALSLNSPLWKTPEISWNFDAIYRRSRDISISGLGGHITTLCSEKNTYLHFQL